MNNHGMPGAYQACHPGAWAKTMVMGIQYDKSDRIFSTEAPVHGSIAVVGDLLVVTLDKRVHEQLAGESVKAGIGAFDCKTGEPRWMVWDLPPLAETTSDAIYAYSRAGLIVALDLDGSERWRARLPDDRSAAGIQRGDRDSPFVGDVVVQGGALFVAVANEILKLSADDGTILARNIICQGDSAIVSRLATATTDDLIVTCTVRTQWDDEQGPPPLLWSTPSSLTWHRILAGDTVLVSNDLEVRHRIAAPDPTFAHLDHLPVRLDDGSVALSGAKIIGEGYSRTLSIYDGWLFVLETDTGRVRWLRQVDHVNPPVVAKGGIFTGLAFFSIANGSQLWESGLGLTVTDSSVPAVFDGKRLLFVDAGAIRALDLLDGQASDLVRFAPWPFHGRPTTNLATANNYAFIGISEAGKPTMLLGIRTSR